MSASIFEQVTSSFTVMSICDPLGPDIPAGTCLAELEDLLDPRQDPDVDPWNYPSRVMALSGDLVGILWFENWGVEDEEENSDICIVDDVMDRPEPWQFLSSATTILEAVRLFTRESSATCFYVIHGNQVVGFLRYGNLFRPVGRLAFLALALEIEDQALKLCQHQPFRDAAWQSISDNRRCKAIELFRQRYACEPEQPRDIYKLIECTQLSDKAVMIWKTKMISAASSRSELLRFFEQLRGIRDQCAHAQSPGSDLISIQKLSKFIDDAANMRKRLNESLLNHRVSRLQHALIL